MSEPIVPQLTTAFEAGVREAFGDLIIKAPVDINEVLDEAADYARQHAGNMIVDLKNTRIVQSIIARSIEEAWPESRVRAAINRTIGLDPRSQNALNNYEKRLIKQNVPLGRQHAMVESYSKTLKAARVRTVARNEIAMAHAAGKRAAWRRMRSMGEVSPNAVRIWRTHKDERVCKVCGPLNGRRASLDEGRVYATGKGSTPVSGAPAHINCRCTEELSDHGTPEIP